MSEMLLQAVPSRSVMNFLPSWACETDVMSLSCALQDSLPPAQSRGLTLAFLVRPGAVPLVVNQASVSNTQDINPGNNSASISTSAFEVGVLPRRFAQLALGDVFRLLLLVSDKGPAPWQGQGLLRRGNKAPWGSSWAVNGTDHTGSSHFEIVLPPEGTKKFVVTGDTEIREGFLDVIGSNGSANHQVAVSFFYQLGGDDLVDSIATLDAPPLQGFRISCGEDARGRHRLCIRGS